MRKIEARDEQSALFTATQLPSIRLGAALLVADDVAGLAGYLSHGSATEPTQSDREAYDGE
jgi:hypothetical protein